MNRLALFFCLVTIITCHHGRAQNQIQLADGIVEGFEEEGIRIFKGIPYAAPPIGNLRWKAPQAVKKWNGVLKCNHFSASAIQATPTPYQMWTEEFLPPVSPLSEDCLYLNVWTPAKSHAEKLPVMFWIHGGGFVAGSGSCPIYDGTALAKKNIIFVSINYRLGVFGFLAHPELSLESGKNSSGNYGLLDQIAALKWVKKNITAFGGDPDNVTIAGQSAGSISVEALILSPLAKGLFQKAIAQSGGFSTEMASRQLNAVQGRGEKLAKALNAKNIAALRVKSAAELLKASSHFPFFPVYDGYVLPKNPIEHLSNRQHNEVSFMAGWTLGDASVAGKKTMTPVTFKTEAKNSFGEKSEAFLKIFPATNQEEANQSLITFSLCKFAILPAHLIAQAGKKSVYFYQFTFVPSDKPNFPNYGSFHSADIPYALHTLHQWNRPWKLRDKKVEQMMSDYWTNFVRTGDPNNNGLPLWKNYLADDKSILEIGDDVKEKSGLFKSALGFLLLNPPQK